MAMWSVVIMICIPNNLNKSDMKDLKTRFDSRYSFSSIIIEGSVDMNSSVGSNSMQDFFDSVCKR